MKAKQLVNYLVFLLTVTSCQYYVELPIRDKDGKLYSECIINEKDTTFIRVRVATPANVNPVEIPVDTVGIRLLSGNEEKTVYKYDGVKSGMYYSIDNFKPGTNVKLEIEVPGRGKMEAEDIVPPVQDFDYERILHGNPGNRKLVFRITYTQHDKDEGCSGIKFLEKTIEQYRITGYDGKAEYKTVEIKCGVPYSLSVQGSMFSSTINGDTIYILQEDSANDKNVVDLTISYKEDTKNPYGHAPDSVVRRNLYNITLFHMSEDLFRYLKSRHDISTNYGARYNLAPTSFEFTNFSGGYGIFGSCSRKESGWVDNYNPVKPLQ